MSRQTRKLEHLWHAIRSELTDADFGDIDLVHNCLPEISLNSLDLRVRVMGLELTNPLYINAITGGVDDAGRINRDLALTARECGLAMAVGSQMAALEDPQYAETFRVVREVNPQGVIFANIGAYATAAMAVRAVEMIEANALQIHLNVPQELFMAEGDTDFTGFLKRIESIVNAVKVPVMVKEVGFGVAREQAAKLQEIGVAAIDVSGKGGANFIHIERKRAHSRINEDLVNWGIPTPISILEAIAGAPKVDLVASGGINSGLLAAKSLAIGAGAVAVASLPAKVLLSEGREMLVVRLNNYLQELRTVMVMTGCASIEELRRAPVVITGKTLAWAQSRGLR